MRGPPFGPSARETALLASTAAQSRKQAIDRCQFAYANYFMTASRRAAPFAVETQAEHLRNIGARSARDPGLRAGKLWLLLVKLNDAILQIYIPATIAFLALSDNRMGPKKVA